MGTPNIVTRSPRKRILTSTSAATTVRDMHRANSVLVLWRSRIDRGSSQRRFTGSRIATRLFRPAMIVPPDSVGHMWGQVQIVCHLE